MENIYILKAWMTENEMKIDNIEEISNDIFKVGDVRYQILWWEECHQKACDYVLKNLFKWDNDTIIEYSEILSVLCDQISDFEDIGIKNVIKHPHKILDKIKKKDNRNQLIENLMDDVGNFLIDEIEKYGLGEFTSSDKQTHEYFDEEEKEMMYICLI